MTSRCLVCLVGPTAAGKTELAIEVAAACSFPVEIVSLDSRQIYRRLDVGTGKPTAAQRAAVPHHLIDCLDPTETFDAGRYRRAVEELLPTLWTRDVVPLLVGGAGFYLRALREGFHALPDDPVRLERLRAEHAGLSLAALRSKLVRVDPASAKRIHPHDRYRSERALEIFALTGRTASDLARDFTPEPVLGCSFEVVHVSPPRSHLHARIERRAAAWLERAWPEEVARLLGEGLAPDCPGLSILGYREVVAHVRQGIPLDETRERVVAATRQYARHQEIWFRKSEAVWRGDPADPAAGNVLQELLAAA